MTETPVTLFAETLRELAEAMREPSVEAAQTACEVLAWSYDGRDYWLFGGLTESAVTGLEDAVRAAGGDGTDVLRVCDFEAQPLALDRWSVETVVSALKWTAVPPGYDELVAGLERWLSDEAEGAKESIRP